MWQPTSKLRTSTIAVLLNTSSTPHHSALIDSYWALILERQIVLCNRIKRAYLLSTQSFSLSAAVVSQGITPKANGHAFLLMSRAKPYGMNVSYVVNRHILRGVRV